MGFIYALRSEQEKTKHTSFWAIHFCVPVMGALLFLAYYSQYASTADSKKLKMILEITTTFFPVLISVIVGLNVALEEKASHFQTLLAVPNRHKNMLAKLTYLYGSGVFALFFLFLLFVIGIQSYFSRNQYGTYYLCGLFRTQCKKPCSCYCCNAGFDRCAASYGLQVFGAG